MIVKFWMREKPLKITDDILRGLTVSFSKSLAHEIVYMDIGYYVWSYIRNWYPMIPAPIVWDEERPTYTLFGDHAAFLFSEYYSNVRLMNAAIRDLTKPKKFDRV